MSLGRFIVWPFNCRVRYTRAYINASDTRSSALLPSATSSHPSHVVVNSLQSLSTSLPLLHSHAGSSSSDPVDPSSRVVFSHRSSSHLPANKFSSAVFSVVVCPVMAAAHGIAACACWVLIFLLPMAHLNASLAIAVCRRPLLLKVERTHELDGAPKAPFNIVRNTQVTCAGGFRFLFARTLGMPNVVLNSLGLVVAVAAVPYLVPSAVLLTPAGAVLFLSATCLTVPPLGYFLCVAITSIAAKTSFAFGAVLNASFGSIIEIILYVGAMKHADTGPELVAKGIVGAILTALLLIPGLSMIVGGIRHEEQKFNRVTAGVSSMLLLVSLLGALLPTMFQRLFGRYEIQCTHCNTNITSSNTTSTKHKSLFAKIEPFSCHKCFMDLTPMEEDDVYVSTTWPLCIMVAIILPALYVIGLIFTLKTHKHRIDQEEADIEGSAHDNDSASQPSDPIDSHDPMNWSVGFSVCVLMACTVIFAIISENLNNASSLPLPLSM
jgi:Ca2+:H+ antiporter